MTQSFKAGKPLRDMMGHPGMEAALDQVKKDFKEGADEVRITQPPKQSLGKAGEPPKPMVTLESLDEKLNVLSQQISRIFGNAALVNGRWVDITHQNNV